MWITGSGLGTTKKRYDRDAISVRLGKRIDRAVIARQRPNGGYQQNGANWRSQWRCICIEEPFTYSNTAHSIYDEMVFDAIKSAFREAHQELDSTRDLKRLLNYTIYVAFYSCRYTSPSIHVCFTSPSTYTRSMSLSVAIYSCPVYTRSISLAIHVATCRLLHNHTRYTSITIHTCLISPSAYTRSMSPIHAAQCRHLHIRIQSMSPSNHTRSISLSIHYRRLFISTPIHNHLCRLQSCAFLGRLLSYSFYINSYSQYRYIAYL
ncbi:hypothetical protein ANCDUO_14851 [Ancylostoma duodenale]|uniref:Uncharacterized protein n=1 Tax=Ancylostoma duodenale TaxID=51022 RepID=A0A0C2G7Y9_9BILA|nr:hypothetical protein ANCDUO_14851 [Ancylostoma duodenale]